MHDAKLTLHISVTPAVHMYSTDTHRKKHETSMAVVFVYKEVPRRYKVLIGGEKRKTDRERDREIEIDRDR